MKGTYHHAIIILALINHLTLQLCSTDHLYNHHQTMKSTDIQSCFISLAIKTSDHQIKALLQHFKPQYSTLLVQALEDQIYKLKQISSQIILGESHMEPVLKWAQNNTISSMGQSAMFKLEKIIILSKLKYLQIYESVHSKSPKDIFLNITQLQQNVGSQEQKWAKWINQINLKCLDDERWDWNKLKHEIWPFLTTKQGQSYNIWIDIAERYEQDYKTYQQMHAKIMKQREKDSRIKNEFYFEIVISIIFVLGFVLL